MQSEINKLKYERMLEERTLRSDIEKIESYLGKLISALKRKYKKRKDAKLSRLAEVKAEIDGNAPQPELFDRNGDATPEAMKKRKDESENRRTGESETIGKVTYRNAEGHICSIPQTTKKRLKQGDTMKVERTLTEILNNGWCDETGELTGCCQCDKEYCENRFVTFGNASACGCEIACYAECPRLIKKDDTDAHGQEGTEPRRYNLDTGMKLSELQRKDSYNAMKAPGDKLILGLDMDNKKIFMYIGVTKKWDLYSDFTTKAATKRRFDELIKAGELDIDHVGEWPKKFIIDDYKGLFRGFYHGDPYSPKKIMFMLPGMNGWVKPEKFSNEEQYNARMLELRKDKRYLES